MATQLHNDGLGKLPDEFLTLYQAFLAGQADVAEVRALLERLMADTVDAAPAIQERLDMDMRVGLLGEHAWENLTAEIDHAVSEDAPTEWSNDLPAFAAAPREVPAEQPAPPRAPTGPLGPGSVLRDRFVLVSRIRSGSMGDVFKALDRRKKEAGASNPWVAVKVIGEAFSRHPASLQALQHEAANGQKLSHPNIVHVFDFDRDGEHFYMTMEWLEGESLVDLLNRHRQQPLPARQAWQIIAGLGRALAHAHAQGVVHADVKPGNVFVTLDGDAKLLDFGIARAAGGADADFDPSVIGAHTPAYSSCEVLEGAEATEADDIYACAAVAYRLLSGHRPYGQYTALEAETASAELEPVPGLTETQMQVLRRALAFRREQRTADATELLTGLLQRPARPVAPETEAPPVGATTSFNWRRPAGVALIIALGIAALTINDDPAPVRVTGPETPGGVAALPTQTRSLPAESPPRPAARQTRATAPAPATESSPAAAPPANRSPAPPQAAAAPVAPDRADTGGAPARETADTGDSRAGDDETPAVSEPPAPAPAPRSTARRAPRPAPEPPSPAPSGLPAAPDPAAAAAPAQASAPAVQLAAAQVAAPDASAPASTGLPDTTPNPAAGVAKDPAAYGPRPAPTPPMVALSELEFDRYLEPRFPRRGITRGESGWVTVQFRVTASGETADVQVVTAEPEGLFEDAALKAVTRWRFKPVLVNGEPTERMSTVRLRFEQQ